MHPLRWFSTFTGFQLLCSWKSKDRGDLNEEKKGKDLTLVQSRRNERRGVLIFHEQDGQPSPGEQHTGNPTEAKACTVPSKQDGKATPCSRPLAGKSSSRKRRREDATVKPEQKLGEAKAAPPSPRQLEEATDPDKAALTDEVKTEKQIALGLLTFSAGAVISAKSTTFGKQPAAEGQEKAHYGFFFWASIALWFTCLLFSLFTVLLTTFRRRSPGLVIYSKFINHFNMCITVIGVAFWILS